MIKYHQPLFIISNCEKYFILPKVVSLTRALPLSLCVNKPIMSECKAQYSSIG